MLICFLRTREEMLRINLQPTIAHLPYINGTTRSHSAETQALSNRKQRLTHFAQTRRRLLRCDGLNLSRLFFSERDIPIWQHFQLPLQGLSAFDRANFCISICTSPTEWIKSEGASRYQMAITINVFFTKTSSKRRTASNNQSQR